MDNGNRLKIIIGAYGSGKSEISVNMALAMRKSFPDDKVLLADLDIVNPFYRSADASKVLEENKIRLISPMYANSNVDAPVLSGEVYVIFDDESYRGVFDIGGEDMGATILGSMKTRLDKSGADLLMAVNTRRPFTATTDEIIMMASELTEASKMNITGFINNTNVLEDTKPEDIIEGERIVREVEQKTGIPLVMTTVMDGVMPDSMLDELKAPEVMKMTRTIHYAY
ncbi:MAG: ATP-binding protein [Clostridiales bacterium]|nr:ATP-binding protein [Clostridiales bacterium]